MLPKEKSKERPTFTNDLRNYSLDSIVRDELVDDGLDKSNHGVHDDKNLGVPLWKLYVRGRVACHFHLIIYTRGKHAPHELCADFQIFPTSCHLPVDVKDALTFQNGTFNSDVVGCDKGWVYHSVLVPVGKLLDDRKGMQFRLAPFLVGLRCLDDCPVERRNFAEGVRATERLAAVLDREFDVRFLCGPERTSAVIDDELPSKLVEPTTQVMCDVSQEYSHAKQPFARYHSDPKYVITRIRVELGAQLDRITFPLEDREDFAFESVAMLTRPIEFSPRSAKVDSHVHSQELE